MTTVTCATKCALTASRSSSELVPSTNPFSPSSSRMLTRIISDAFDNSLFIACLSPLDTDKSESIYTLKYVSEFYTMEKKLLLNNKSSKDCSIDRYFLLNQII